MHNSHKTNQILLPKSNWNAIVNELIAKKINEKHEINPDLAPFIAQLKYLNDDGTLSELGTEITRLEFVRRDTTTANQIHHKAVLSLPATQAIIQSLWGVDSVDVTQVKNALLFLGVEEQLLNKRLVNMLEVLNRNKIIVFNRKSTAVNILVAPLESAQSKAPDHIYIDSARPFSNDVMIREILREARGKLMWLDKYFQKEGFEWLLREADANNIHSIEIVSSDTGKPTDPHALSDYKKLKKELGIKGISLEWRILARNDSHDFHDRWILDDNGLCYNVPSINSIKSGQKSELHKSPNGNEVRLSFDKYFKMSAPAV